MGTERDTEVERLASLVDDNRRRLYDHVAAQRAPVTRDEAAAALEMDRSLVAYHLDKLVESGLLTASFARPPGRSGPGAGRPAKRYERTADDLAVSVPPRDYELAARTLARAVDIDDSGRVRDALDEAATELGSELAATDDDVAGDLESFLERRGYEPYRDGEVIRLGNCPFHRLAQQHTELVCGMNLALLAGAVAAVGADATVRLDPAPDRCCVAFDPS